MRFIIGANYYDMGATQSSEEATHRVTVENPNEIGLIRISDSVAKRWSEQTGSTPPSESSHDDAPPPGYVEESAVRNALKKLESKYESKLRHVEEKLRDSSRLSRMTTEQLNVAAADVERKFCKQTFNPVCEELESALLQCYEANPKRILKCSDAADKFVRCVNSYQKELTGSG